MQYTFQTSRYQVSALLPEVSAALEKRMEAEGRKRLPGLWKAIDRRRGGKEPVIPNEMTRGRRIYRRVVGTLLLLVGLFLVIPGFMAPDELFGPLLVGCFAVGTAIYYLYSTRKGRRSSFEKQAQRLLEKIAAAEPQPVVFTDAGLQLKKGAPVPYQEMAFYAETPSGVLLNWGDQATFLQKKDLTDGSWEEFADFLQERLEKR